MITDANIFPKHYTYRPNLLMTLLGFVLFGAAAPFLYMEASTLIEGVSLRIFHLITFDLSQTQGRIFLYVLSALSAGFAAVSLFQVYLRFTTKQEIFLTTTSISHIKNHETIKEVQIKDISSMSMFQVHGTHTLTIVHSNGKMSLTSAMLSDKKYLYEIADALTMLQAKLK